MRSIGLILIVSAGLVLAGCGGTSSTTTSGNAVGTWNATFISSTGVQTLAFTFVMMQASNNAINAASLTIQQGSACFPVGSGMTMTGTANAPIVAGQGGQQLNMTFSGSNNVLTMTGSINPDGHSAVGSYILTSNSPNCLNDTGSWTMTRQ